MFFVIKKNLYIYIYSDWFIQKRDISKYGETKYTVLKEAIALKNGRQRLENSRGKASFQKGLSIKVSMWDNKVQQIDKNSFEYNTIEEIDNNNKVDWKQYNWKYNIIWKCFFFFWIMVSWIHFM